MPGWTTMGVDRFGNTTCDVCSIKIFNGIPFANRKVGNDGYALCSQSCLDQFEVTHQQASEKIQAAVEDAVRKAADEQRGWKMHRWWNQQYTHRKKAFDTWKTEQEFKRIQRKEKRRR